MSDITAQMSTFKATKGSVYIIFHNSDSVLIGKKKTYQYYHPIPSIPRNKKTTMTYKGKAHPVDYITVQDQVYSIFPQGFPCNLNKDTNSEPLDDEKEYYCFPGGKLEPNENVFAAAKREFYEETGIDLNDIKYQDGCQMKLKEYNDKGYKYYALIVSIQDTTGAVDLSTEVERVNGRLQDTQTNFIDKITDGSRGRNIRDKPSIPDDELAEVTCLDRTVGYNDYFVNADRQGWYRNIFNDLFL